MSKLLHFLGYLFFCVVVIVSKLLTGIVYCGSSERGLPNQKVHSKMMLFVRIMSIAYSRIPILSRNNKFLCTVKNRYGLMCIRPFVFSDDLVASGFWEPYVTNIFKVSNGDVVFDVGAHIGLYTIRACKAAGSEGKVIAVEPHRENFSILKINVLLNRLENAIILNAAAGETETIIPFDSTNPLHAKKSYSSNVPEVVKQITIDGLVEYLKLMRVDWIKIDAEGSEIEVLKGSIKTLHDFDVRVILEIDPINLKYATEFLELNGYRLSKLFRWYYYAEKPNRQEKIFR